MPWSAMGIKAKKLLHGLMHLHNLQNCWNAKTEIANRWTNAVREYEDSLSNFACMSGGRYLGKYNDYVEVPELKKTEEENK